MKNFFSVAVIAVLAVATAVAAQDAQAPLAVATAVAAQDSQAPLPVATTVAAQDAQAPLAADVNLIPTSTTPSKEEALWKKKKIHKLPKHHKHGKKNKCCIKYVTVTSVPQCKPEPTKCVVPVP